MKRSKSRDGRKPDGSLRARWEADDRQECLSHRGLERLESRLMLAADVVINEIMYHPFSPGNPSAADQGEEYIELYNKGNAAANLTGWHFTRGIDYTFGGGTLAARGYLVVAADLGKFGAKY